MNVHHNIQNFTDYLNKPSNIDFTFEPTSENDFYKIFNNLKIIIKIVRVKMKSLINY